MYSKFNQVDLQLQKAVCLNLQTIVVLQLEKFNLQFKKRNLIHELLYIYIYVFNQFVN